MDNEEKKYFHDIKMALRKLSEIGVPVTPIIKAVMNAESELAESEDERIRKFLVQHISEWIGCIEHDLTISSKDIESEKELAMFKDALAYLERQKEQKPVHTAKEMWKEMRLEVYAQASGNRHEPNYSDDSTKMFSLCDIDEIFEKIGNSTVGSQTAEWSEEDEENFKWFDKFFRAESVVAGGRDIPQDKYLWFNSLRDRQTRKD